MIQKCPNWAKLCFDLCDFDPGLLIWRWVFAWTTLLSMTMTPDNFMMMQSREHCEKDVRGRQTDGLTDAEMYRTIHKAAWLQLKSLEWRHNGHDGISNHQPHDCLLNRLFKRRSNKTSKPHVTGLCEVNSMVTGEFPHKWPVTQKMFPFNDVIMSFAYLRGYNMYGTFLKQTMAQRKHHIDSLVHDCSNPNALAVELLQSCTKPFTPFSNFTDNFITSITSMMPILY